MSSPRATRTAMQEPTPDLFSSSPPGPANTIHSRKPRRPPPITPKRFTRFFTPRNSKNVSSRGILSSSGRQLQDITRAALNRSNAAQRTTPRKTVNFVDVENQMVTPQSSARKRKHPYLSPESSPAQSSPIKRSRYVTPPPVEVLEDPIILDEPRVFPQPIRRMAALGRGSRILQRSFGGMSGVGRGFRVDHCASWQSQTAEFYSNADDLHQLPQGAPPFCTASCNTNSLVAIGDEDGYIHLLDSEGTFSKSQISWKAHSNAIMDLQFSSDDSYLAAGSGDQTAQIVDVRTQQTLAVLAKHKSSVKQVRFQPGDDKVVATSSRDGAVQIWDLRCKGGHMSVHSAWGSDAPYASVIRTLASAHADTSAVAEYGAAGASAKGVSGKTESMNRRNDISVTALSFLPEGRQHLLLTASDASTSVKLWDIRGRYSLRGPAIPISTTLHPESHNRHRHFAINSITLSGDATRLYALSKDNTVYAYSTNHLILGSAPELSTSSKQKFCQVGQEGLGPIYGFRHRNFHAGSFYVKASLRKQSNDQSELLAVGSTDGCPVLFPTDETFLRRERQHHEDEADELPDMSFSSRRTSSRLSLSRKSTSTRARVPDTIPIYEHGTPLIRGHEAEVTSVTWAQNGSLISVSDDFRVRRWREGSNASALRTGGESEGRRWMCGWADVGDNWDEEE